MTMTSKTLTDAFRTAETGEQFGVLCAIEVQAIALVARRGYVADDITQVNLADDGTLASVECGIDDDGMSCFVLNFAL
jgi:hypothetical protein